jgi:glutamine synthetase
MKMGVEVPPDSKKDTTDRNRTSPFAFTGNRFEFRMLGSAVNIASANIILNTAVADELKQFADELEKADDFDKAVKKLVAKTLKEHDRIIFNGNNYADEWVIEAEKRGLLNLKSVPQAVAHYMDEKNVRLFTENNVFSKEELHARYEVDLENYAKIINIEALTMLDMAKKDIIPAVTAYVKELTDTALSKKALSAEIPVELETKLVASLSQKLVCFSNKTEELANNLIKAGELENDMQAYADFYCDTVFVTMQELRAIGDDMETETSSEYWPYPSYGEMLFGV